MKRYIFAVLAAIGLAGNAWAQRDITSQYITNATLSDGTNGWTKTFTKTKQVTDPADAFSNSQMGNNTVGYATEAYAGWDELIQTAYSMKQTITLPKGNYRLVNYSFFRQGQAYNTNSNKSLAYLKAGSHQKTLLTLGSIPAAGYANSQGEGANCFDSKMYRNTLEFSIDADNTPIEIGIEGTFDEARSWCIVGMFELFDLDDVATVTSPTDVTYAITNPGFEYRDLTGWTTVQDNTSEHKTFWYMDNDVLSNKAGKGWVESYQGGGIPDGRAIYQTLTGLANGLYEVTVYGHLQQGAGSDGFYLYANSDRVAIGSTDQDYSVRTTVTDGQLTIKLCTEGCNGNWAAFDKVRLKFYGDPLQAYKELLAEKVEAAQTLVNGGTLRTGAANQLQTIINNNDNDDNAFTTEAEFQTAVTNIEAGIAQANDIAATYPVYDAFRDLCLALENGVETCDSKTAFDNAIAAANTAVENATSTDVAETQKAAVRAAALTFISSVDGQFDITFLASQNYWDWKRKDGSAAGIVQDQFLTNRPTGIPSFAENFEWTAATTGNVLYQTVSNLPAGYYQVGMYTMALSTSGRDTNIVTEATEGDANRSFAFAGDLSDASSIQRTGMPIKFATAVDFDDLTTLDVNVHLASDGDLTFGVQKDANGSNWHFAQIVSIVYSNAPDLTGLKATRDALVSEAEGLLAGADAALLTPAQQQALQDAIDAGNEANDFDALNTVTLTTLPNAINTAKQQIQQVKSNREGMIVALERFENDYNLADGTDYRRLTMSAEAWTDLLAKVNAVTTALDDVSQASNYGTIKDALIAQMDATDTSLRIFKSYKAMSDGVCSVCSGITAADSEMDTDATEQAAITAYNTTFVTHAAAQVADFDASAFLGENLDFSAAEGSALNTDNSNNIHAVNGWEVNYADADTWAVIQTDQADNTGKLYMRKNWGSSATTLEVFKEKMLPVGKYTLSLSWNSDMANMTNRSAFTVGTVSTPVGEATTEAKTLTYDFEVTDAPQTFDLTFGFQKTNTGNTPAQIIVDDICLTYVQPTVMLADGSDNSETITAYTGKTRNVTIEGRTLYKDGGWNTICLPFNATLDDALANATLMELDTETEVNGHVTGLEGTTLYLNFKTAESIVAGTPYIIKWDNGNDNNIESPTFNSVTFVETGALSVGCNGVTFNGTYVPIVYDSEDTSVLLMGSDDTLYYPQPKDDETPRINAFRAYFQLSSATPARQFVLNFGDNDVNAIDAQPILNAQPATRNPESVYDLQGRHVSNSKWSNGQIKKGLYIVNGQKVVK